MDFSVTRMSKLPAKRQSVTEFLDTAEKHALTKATANRLIFALDATASRERTWDVATSRHAELFRTAKSAKLGVQLAYYRGFNEFRASSWSSSADALLKQMQAVRCLGGQTQITRLLGHIHRESMQLQLKAAVFIGDACEEDSREILSIAGQLGLRQVPLFVLQEGQDLYATQVFSGMATRSGGAHIPLSMASADELAQFLGAVAVFATEGRGALERLANRTSRHLLTQLKR